MKTSRPVKNYMSPIKYFIEPLATLEEAEDLMIRKDVRHLPIYENDALVGIISDRDIRAASSRKKEALCVGDVMATNPLVKPMDEEVHAIVTEMLEKRYGSVVLCSENREITGIFTTVDALKLLRSLLEDS